jgi:ABC-2 type transport system permease protein
MAVYKRGYQRYDGPLTGRPARLMVLPRFAWGRLMEQRLVLILFVVSLFWPVACGLWVYLVNNAGLLQGLERAFADFLRIDGQFFVVFMNAQATFAVILAAFAGPSLIAPDLANGALPLYFSRPLSRWDYTLSRMLVLVGILSPVTWVPGVILFLMQSGMAGWTWFAGNWKLGTGVFLGFVAWIIFVGLVALACSAYVKWRIIAGALVLAVFFILAGAAEITNQVLRAEWATLANPTRDMNQIWRWMLGAEAQSGPGALACLLAMAAMALALLGLLRRKLRPVEVVS